MGSQHAELVVIGVGHDGPIDIALADVDSPRAQRDESVDFGLLIAVISSRAELGARMQSEA